MRILIDTNSRFLDRDFGTCLVFNGVSDYATATTLGSFGSTSLAATFSIAFWVKTTSTAQGIMFGTANNTGGANPTAFWVRLNTNSTQGSASGFLGVFIRDNDNKTYVFASSASLGINDGDWHHIAISITPTSNASSMYFDGAQVAVTNGAVVSPVNFSNFEFALGIGMNNFKGTPGTFFAGSLDKFKLYTTGLTATDAADMYRRNSPTSNLFVGYEMDEGSGTSLTDSSGNARTGTISSATYSSVVFQKPRTAVTNRFLNRDMISCLSFDGVDDVISVTNSASLQLTGDWSATAWIYPVTLGEGSGGRIFEKSNEYGFFLGSNNDIAATNFSSTKTSNTGVITLNKWQHIAATYSDSGDLTSFYLNGNDIGTSAQLTNPASSTNALMLGNRAAGDRTFRGLLDEITLYKGQVLTQAQIQDIYYKGIYPTTGLSGLWLFNEGSGSSATDSSGNSNTGSITGAVYSTNVFLKPRTLIS